MNIYGTKQIRNVVLLGHGGAGKTTVAEALAYLTGVTKRMGKVADGNTISDYDKEEIKRQFSISTTMVPIEYEGAEGKIKINLLDTPGYFDFVGEVEEALSFCDRVIRELPPEISAYAYFTKGRILIRRYDERAIELIYQAIENNSNLIQNGLDEIGYFCCLIGNRAELERYRKMADELMQKNEDEYRQLGILTPSDQLEREELPDGKLDTILSYIHSVDENQIQHIWLVRKILPTGMASSVFIVQFKKECPPDQQEEIYQKLFCYLDTLDDRCYSLILYDKLMCKNFKKVKGSCVC